MTSGTLLQQASLGKLTLKLNDCVLVYSQSSKGPEVGRILSITQAEGGVDSAQLQLCWFYGPEQVLGGRQPFHGAKELIETDEVSSLSLKAVKAKCRVHSLDKFQELSRTGPNDFFARYGYKVSEEEFVPPRVPVFCRCELPYNPDRLMVQCHNCFEWYHPECLQVNIRALGAQSKWSCPDCRSTPVGEEGESESPAPSAAEGMEEDQDTAAATAAAAAVEGYTPR